MTSVQNFPIPEIVTPPTRVCVTFTIPNSDDYRQIFLGWFDQLCYWYNWQRDTDHNAMLCAELFKISRAELIESLTTGCNGDDMYIRFREKPDEPKITQVQYEIDGEWFDGWDMTCCPVQVVTNTRFTDTGAMQVSYDGGATWVDAPPGTDPRNSGTIGAPIAGVPGNDKRCLAASSATEALKGAQTDLANDTGAWAGLTGILAALVGLLIFIGIIGSAGALTPILLGLAAALLEGGREAFLAAFTTEVWHDVQCIIFCHTSANADPYTAGQIAAIRADLQAKFTGVAWKWLDSTIGEVWGQTGLTNAARTGLSNDVTCDDCECGCLADAWTIGDFGGIEIERGDDYIIAESTFDSVGGTNISVKSITPGSCCYVHREELTTTVPHSYGVVGCGLEQIPANFGTNDGRCCNMMVALTPIAVDPNNHPYRIKWTFSEPEDCP